MNRFKKIIIGLIILLITIPAISYGILYFKLKSMYQKDNVTNQKEEIEEIKINKEIINILLVGLDGTNIEKGNRSDSMMILTIDKKNKNLKLTSLARDTYVDIPGYDTEKLTHAYAYEGINLLIETIEKNFNVDIDRYITVNFNSFIDIVDIIGGVEVEVTENDIEILNKYIKTSYNFDKKDNKEPIQYINSPGIHKLNGYQALAFSRTRYQDSAYDRDARQREVIQSIINSINEQDLKSFIDIINIGIKNSKTNMKPGEIISIGYDIIKIKDKEVRQLEFPVYKNGEIVEGKGWVIKWDKEKNLKILNDFINNNIEVEENK